MGYGKWEMANVQSQTAPLAALCHLQFPICHLKFRPSSPHAQFKTTLPHWPVSITSKPLRKSG